MSTGNSDLFKTNKKKETAESCLFLGVGANVDSRAKTGGTFCAVV